MSRNPLSNESYTNKDFTSIYVELLDLVKKLTYKWDPSISNESDPGNILLKLNAIIGDKNNYNIDKNILENFPETLTQEISARSLYKQLAYHMPWYRSATTKITFKWCGEGDYDISNINDDIIIPAFQTVTDPNNEFVYTTLNSVTLSKIKPTNMVEAAEGMLTNLDVNGQTILGLSNLDYNNRIYFNENTVSEKHIYVKNYNTNLDNIDSCEEWTCVENLQIQPLSSKCFEFGVDSRRNMCYLEFPSDISTLIGNGLTITYISTSGSRGNIISRTLDRFYKEFSVNINGNDTVLNNTLVQIINESAASNGTDPESVEDAYKNYRKTVGTFNTLVTLRDYINAIYTSGLVSNVIVCDRLNDVQSTFDVVVDEMYSENNSNIVHKSFINDNSHRLSFCKVSSVYNNIEDIRNINCYIYEGGALTSTTIKTTENFNQLYYLATEDLEDLKAFDLRLYLLHTPNEGLISSLDDYNSTFNVEEYDNSVYKNVIGYINSQKCIQHNFRELLKDIPFIFKNMYPLDIKIIPHYKLGDEQINDLKININKALFNKINSSRLIFGEEANYNEIYDTIFNADPRIKVLILDDINYTTFATYWNGTEFVDVPISDFNSSNIIKLSSTDDQTTKNIIKTEYSNTLSDYMYKHTYFVDGNNHVWKIGIDNEPYEASTLMNDIRKDIITKSILSGKTPYAVNDDRFKYSLDQQYKLLSTADSISTNLEIWPYGANKQEEPVNTAGEKGKISVKSVATYALQANETIKFMAPSFITDKTFSNYVKYEVVLNKDGKSQAYEKTLTYSDYLLNPKGYNSKDITVSYADDNGNSHIYEHINVDIDDDILIYLYNKHKQTNLEYLLDNQDNHVESSLNRICCIVFNFTDDSGINETVKFEGKLHDLINTQQIKSISSDSGKTYFLNASNLDKLIYVPAQEPDGDNEGSVEKVAFNSIFDIEHIIKETNGNDILLDGDLLYWYFYSKSYPDVDIKCSLISNIKILDLATNFEENLMDYWKSEIATISTTEYVRKIDANSDYKLRQNEYAIFFYRTEDKEDAPYIYEKYTAGSIIRPNFNLEGVDIDNAIVTNVNSLVNNIGKIPFDNNSNSMYQRVYNMNQQNDLSGTKSVDIRRINQRIISGNENFNYYFITRRFNEDRTKYKLTPNEQCEYILENEEYFIYTNKDKTSFELLGEGTLLIFASTETLYVDKVDYIDIMNKGIDIFSSKCKPINGDLTIMEQQLYAFAEGDTITFECIREADPIVINTNNYTPIDMNKYSIQYASGTAVSEYLPQILIDDNVIAWRATCTFNLLTSNEEPQQISNTYTTIDGKPYYIAKRSLTINNETYTPNIDQDNTDLYLYSDVPINKVGGVNTDITYLDINSKRNSPYLYLYMLNDSAVSLTTPSFGSMGNDCVKVTKPSADKIEFKLFKVPANNTCTVTFTNIRYFDSHDFLLKLYNNSNYIKFRLLTKPTGESDDKYKQIDCINRNSGDFYGKGISYFRFKKPDNVDSDYYDLQLEITKPLDGKTHDEDVIVFANWYRVQYDDIFQTKYNISQQDIDNCIKKYDIGSEFDYSHVVDTDKYIRDPLEAKSFFNVYHPFNQFTIPMGDLYMSSKNKSNITLINNR